MSTIKSNISTTQTLKVGATTITAATITALPVMGVHGLHDCTSTGAISLMNCVWPSAYAGGSGMKTEPNATTTALANSMVGVSVTNGLTINMREADTGGTGNISVTFT
jgi:hypothetical protein